MMAGRISAGATKKTTLIQRGLFFVLSCGLNIIRERMYPYRSRVPFP